MIFPLKHCAVPENILTHPLEGRGNSEGVGGVGLKLKWNKKKEQGG